MGEEGTQAPVKSNVVPKITKSLARPPPPAPLSRPSTLSVPLSLSTPPPRPPIFTRLSRASSFPVLDDRRSQPLGLAYFALLVTRRRPVALIPLERPTAHPLERTTLPFSASHDLSPSMTRPRSQCVASPRWHPYMVWNCKHTRHIRHHYTSFRSIHTERERERERERARRRKWRESSAFAPPSALCPPR